MNLNQICNLVVIGAFIFELAVVLYLFIWKKQIFSASKRIFDYFPTSLSTLGVLGTFLGIYVGLQRFDPSNIQASIPVLLEGLKTAFSTSLLGMGGSLILSFIINILSDVNEGQHPTQYDILAEKIDASVDKMSKNVVRSMDKVRKRIEEEAQAKMMDYDSLFQDKLLEGEKLVQDSIINAQEQSRKLLENCNGQIAEKMAECDRIVLQRISDCNLMLDQKLDQFGKSIAKSNTEALSGVMAAACQTFEKSMGQMLGELVKENFSELNGSIKTLSQWQEDNVLMINELSRQCSAVISQMKDSSETMSVTVGANTIKAIDDMKKQGDDVISRLQETGKQMSESLGDNVNRLVSDLAKFSHDLTSDLAEKYSRMVADMDNTSSALEKVAEYTRAISGAEGELGTLVQALQEVLISDHSFIKVSHDLAASASRNADSIEKLNNISQTLSRWVSTNTNMETELHQLLSKLEELNRMRDFNSGFWESAKKQFEEGIHLLESGTRELNRQIATIDQHFYERLSVTMANLDECLSKAIESKDKH